MAVGISGVSSRARFSIAAVSMGAVAIVALVVLTFRSRVGGAITASPISSAAKTVSPNSSVASGASQAEAIAKAKGMIASMPSCFEVNQGQTDPSVKYLSRSGRYSMFLTDDATTIISMVGGQIHKGPAFAMSNPAPKPDADRLVESDVRIRLVGANPHPAVMGLEPLPGRVNYLIGDDKSKWHTNIATFGRVKFAGVYPGVDLVHYGIGDTLEYDIVAAPGADTSRIKLAVEGNAKTVIDKDGNLQIMTPAGVVVMHKPSVYQDGADGVRTPVGGRFVLTKDATIEAGIHRREVKIQLAAYDHRRELVVDPVASILIYSTYLGGSASSSGGVNLEQFGGITGGTALTVADVGLDVALDSSNNAYVTGIAYSNDFPVTPGAFQATLNGANPPPKQNPNAFVAKFNTLTAANNNASLVYATYLGGAGDTLAADAGNGDGDLAFGVAVDAGDQAFVVGQTYSSGTDTTTGFPGTHLCGAFGQNNDQGAPSTNVGFISKLNSTGSGVIWSCYIDGSENATESRVALYPVGCGTGTQCQAYLSGATQSTIAQGFPGTPNRFQTDLKATGGKSNATFIVVNADGQSLEYATHYGGSGNGTNADAGIAVAVDANGDGYITGATFSSDLSLKNAAFSTYEGGGNTPKTSNAFVAEFNPNQAGTVPNTNSLIYATYLGGHGAVGTIQILAKKFTIATGDLGTGIAVDANGDIWVTGATASTDFQEIPGNVGTSFQQFNEAGSRHDCIPSGANPPATAIFVMQLDPIHQTLTNQVRYSTYFGGCGIQVTPGEFGTGSIGFGDAASDLQVIGSKVYFTGATTSGTNAGHDFPLSAKALACNATFRLDDNQSSGFSFGGGLVNVPVTAFASELDTSQATTVNELIFSALLGGTGTADIGGGIAVDSFGDMVVAGLTYSTDFPITPNAFQVTNRGKNNTSNAFLTVIDPSGVTCPTPFPTATATATATGGTPTVTATATKTATATVTATSTRSATPTATSTATNTATATPTATTTKTATSTATKTATPTATPTATATPTVTPTAVSSPTTLSASPTTIKFGSVDATATSEPKKVTLSNKGTAAAVIGTVTATPPFEIAGGANTCSGQTIAAKKKCSFDVEFAPTTVTNASGGSIDVPYNGTSPTMSLSGDGIAVTLKAPSKETFSPVAAGGTGKSKKVKISNPATVSVSLGATSIGGSDPSAFTITANSCTGTLAAKPGTCTITMEFTPGSGASGAQSATVGFSYTYGANDGSVSIPISGKVK